MNNIDQLTAHDLALLIEWAAANPDRPPYHDVNAAIYRARKTLESMKVVIP